MAIDDELDAMKPAGMPTEMERWNVEDLQDYIDRMRAEIARVCLLYTSPSPRD